MMQRTMKDRNFITALARGLAILEAFDGSKAELGITEISQRVGLAKTTTFRLVQTLITLRYLLPSVDGNKCRLGPRVLSLGYAALQGLDLRVVASPFLRALSVECGETVNMAVLDGDDLVYIERIKTQQIININLHVGSRLSLYNTSMGRALLAYQPAAWLQGYIERTSKIPDAARFLGKEGVKLLDLLVDVRARKYAVNDQDLAVGLRSIATPVWNEENSVSAAINVAVPSARISLNELETEYAPQLLATARAISEALGYRGDPGVFTSDAA